MSLQRLALEYGVYAEAPKPFEHATVYRNALLFPPDQRTENWGETAQWLLLLAFTRNGLEQAARHASLTRSLVTLSTRAKAPNVSCPPDVRTTAQYPDLKSK